MSEQFSVPPPPRHTHTQEMLAFCTSGMDEIAEIKATLDAVGRAMEDTPDHAIALAVAIKHSLELFEQASRAVVGRMQRTATNARVFAAEMSKLPETQEATR